MPPARLPEHFHWLTVQRYDKKQLFAIVCSDFVLKSAHIFNIYTENQAVTKPLNISHLKRESVSFLSKSFLSFSKNKNTFHLYKEYIYTEGGETGGSGEGSGSGEGGSTGG